MLVFVRTFTLTHENFLLTARYYHSLTPASGNGRLAQLTLLGKRIALTVRRTRRSSIGRRRVLYRHKRPTPLTLNQSAAGQRRKRRKRLLMAPNYGRRQVWNGDIRKKFSFILFGTNQSRANGTSSNNANVNPVSIKDERNPSAVQPLPVLPTPVVTPGLQEQVTLSSMQEVPLYQHPLATDASAQQTSQWLQTNRFSSHLRTFASFSGADILRLSRDDIIQICGLADGIRLFNALHSKAIVPRLTLYLCLEPGAPYHALYLSTLTSAEVATKLAALLGVSVRRIHDVFVEGPSGIRVCVSDDVVGNIRDESTFTVEVLQDHSGERYRLLLKPANP